MGSPQAEKGHNANEGPQHKVKIAPFWMAKTETTWNCHTLFMYKEEEKMVMKLRGFAGLTPFPMPWPADHALRRDEFWHGHGCLLGSA